MKCILCNEGFKQMQRIEMEKTKIWENKLFIGATFPGIFQQLP